jgi:hypothetical protein
MVEVVWQCRVLPELFDGLMWRREAGWGVQRTFFGEHLAGISCKTTITFKIWVLGEIGSGSHEAGKSGNWKLKPARSLLHRHNVGVVPPRGAD